MSGAAVIDAEPTGACGIAGPAAALTVRFGCAIARLRATAESRRWSCAFASMRSVGAGLSATALPAPVRAPAPTASDDGSAVGGADGADERATAVTIGVLSTAARSRVSVIPAATMSVAAMAARAGVTRSQRQSDASG